MKGGDPHAAVNRAELSDALAVIREHAYIMSRIVMAASRDDQAAVDALGLRLGELDAELAERWGLSEIPVGH